MKKSRHQNVARRKRRIERRLRPRTWHAQSMPMYRASNVQYEHSDRVRGLATTAKALKGKPNKWPRSSAHFLKRTAPHG